MPIITWLQVSHLHSAYVLSESLAHILETSRNMSKYAAEAAASSLHFPIAVDVV